MRSPFSIFSSNDEDDEPEFEPTTEERERVLSKDFQRVEVEFNFVRGGNETYEYDKFDGRIEDNPHIVGAVKNGIRKGTRAGDVAVEKLCQVVGGKPRNEGGENLVLPYGREEHEVVPANVNGRSVVERTDMSLRVPVKEKVQINPDTGEVIRRFTPRSNGEPEVVERTAE